MIFCVSALTDMKTLTQEGIYRKNGSAAQIRDLTKLFNQGTIVFFKECV